MKKFNVAAEALNYRRTHTMTDFNGSIFKSSNETTRYFNSQACISSFLKNNSLPNLKNGNSLLLVSLYRLDFDSPVYFDNSKRFITSIFSIPIWIQFCIVKPV